ncbi:MAG: tRNA adenosine(34) deaminase TadA [Candidatus Metalachnospira sp.]|nr:tRNA adenosine(34) deaminase TadA [Candidatus Metalachnospira sp.]
MVDAIRKERYFLETSESLNCEQQKLHEQYMNEALKEAYMAIDSGEVPIGCVIVCNGKIIGRGHNLRNSKKNPLYHAEIIAINDAANLIGDWRLEECTLYVTVEPCPMCAGAIVQARIPNVVFGTRNVKAGCAGSILNILDEPKFNHQVNITEGILQPECARPMSDFFKKFRKKVDEDS